MVPQLAGRLGGIRHLKKLERSFLLSNTWVKMSAASSRPSSDMAEFREIYKKSKHIVALTGKEELGGIGEGFSVLPLLFHNVSHTSLSLYYCVGRVYVCAYCSLCKKIFCAQQLHKDYTG